MVLSRCEHVLVRENMTKKTCLLVSVGSRSDVATPGDRFLIARENNAKEKEDPAALHPGTLSAPRGRLRRSAAADLIKSANFDSEQCGRNGMPPKRVDVTSGDALFDLRDKIDGIPPRRSRSFFRGTPFRARKHASTHASEGAAATRLPDLLGAEV